MSEEVTARAVIIHDNDVILLFRRKIKKGKKREFYALPGGHLENNETNEECVIREIKEELGIDVKILSYLGTVKRNEHLDYIYNCEWISGNLVLGGEEKEQNNPNNFYDIQKIDIKDIENIVLYPGNLKMIKKALLERSNNEKQSNN